MDKVPQSKFSKILCLTLTRNQMIFEFSKLTWLIAILIFIISCSIPKNVTNFDFNYNCDEMIYKDQIDIWPQPKLWHRNMTEMGQMKLRHYSLSINLTLHHNAIPNLFYKAPKSYSHPMSAQDQSIGKKGIVMLVTKHSFKMVYSNIITIRSFSDIPIELFHYDELKPAQEIVFSNMKDSNVVNLKELVFISQPIQYTENTRNYQLKSASILASQFEDILFLDSDNVPVKDPSTYFDMPEYEKFGLIMWPDIWKTHPKNPIHSIFNSECSNQWELEAGQLLVNKKKHMKTLLMSYYITQDRDFWFDVFFGDKDVMRYAAKFVNLPYKVVPWFTSLVGYLDRSQGEKFFCGLVMLQNGFKGEPMFFHANQVKYRGNIGKDYFQKTQVYRYAYNNKALKPLLVSSSNGYGCTALGERSENEYTKIDVKDTSSLLGDFVDRWIALREELMESWD
eukprot:NODE_198_length_13236_cov_1.328385.p4 type:complete len:451 gc:universal NODE_198_length_13236_cov_1.328385:10053-8701(-)